MITKEANNLLICQLFAKTTGLDTVYHSKYNSVQLGSKRPRIKMTESVRRYMVKYLTDIANRGSHERQ